MQITLISFGDKRLKPSKNRLYKQALKSKLFDFIKIFDEEDLHQNFKIKHHKILNRQTRGFGYWIWKPYIILNELKKINENDILIYLDIGCDINYKNSSLFSFYINQLNQSKGILASILSNRNKKEKYFTFHEILRKLEVNDNLNIINSPQIEATGIWIKKNDFSLKLINHWFEFCDQNSKLLNPKLKNDLLGFIENKSDQSVFSILMKKYNAETLPQEYHYLKNNNILQLRNYKKLFLFSRNLRKNIKEYLLEDDYGSIIRNFILDIYNFFNWHLLGYKKPRFFS